MSRKLPAVAANSDKRDIPHPNNSIGAGRVVDTAACHHIARIDDTCGVERVEGLRPLRVTLTDQLPVSIRVSRGLLIRTDDTTCAKEYRGYMSEFLIQAIVRVNDGKTLHAILRECACVR